MASCLLPAIWVRQATCWFSASHTKREQITKRKFENMKPEEVWKLWTFLSIVLRPGLDLDEWFRCHSLSPGKAPFSSVMDCWRHWVVGKPGFEPSLWVRPRESNLSQEHRISNYWVSLSFVLRQLDIFHGMQNGCCVWWFEDKMVVRGTLKALSLVWFQQEGNLTVVLPCSRWISMSLGFKIRRSRKAFFCESSCLPLVTTLQNQNAALSKIFLLITQIARDLMA